MSVCLVAIGDGRDEYHARSWASLREMMPEVEHEIVIDDRAHELGFGGAIRAGWRLALQTDAEYIVHAELDFVYLRPVQLEAMISVLANHSWLVQMALLRGPVNDAEWAAGGVIEQHPDDYHTVNCDGSVWREHRRHVTTNPAVWPRWVIERGWPSRSESEGHFGIELFRSDASLRAAYWGTTVDVLHIGDVRTGTGY